MLSTVNAGIQLLWLIHMVFQLTLPALEFFHFPGYDALILLFSKDKSMGKRRALAFVPVDAGAVALCADIVQQMFGTPTNLPEELRQNPLYQTLGWKFLFCWFVFMIFCNFVAYVVGC